MSSVRLVATFPHRRAAARAQRDLAGRVGRDRVRVGRHEDEEVALRGEMGDEVRSATMGPGSVGPFTKGQSRGAVIGVAWTAPAGALLGALGGLAFTPGDVSVLVRVLIGVAAGGFGGATIGFMWGAFRPRFEGEGAQMAAETGITLSVVDLTMEEAKTLAARLEPTGVARIDLSDEDGQVLETISAEDERPVRGSHTASKPPAFEGEDPGTEGPEDRR